MSQTTKPKQVPLDILQVDSFLRDFRADLTDVMMMAVDEWSAALQDDVHSWRKSDGPEPGWQSFRDWMNEICREDVMPLLFPEPTPEAATDEQTESLAESNQAGFVAGKGDPYDYLPDWMQLPPLYHNENQPNPLAVIKLFTPDSSWTWFLMEYDGDDLLFGLVAGLETEFGYVSLRELQSVTGPMGLRIERDLWFRPTPVRELPEYKERWGEGGPYPGPPPICDPPPDSPTPSEPGNTEIPRQLEGHKLSAASLPKENAAGSAAPIRELPDGWTADDIYFLLELLAEGPILVAENGLGIPTIHNHFGAETRHLGFGLMQVEGDHYTLRFDAGGAMQHSPSGKSWTRLTIEGEYKNYDPNTVRQTLLGWLLPEYKPEEIQPWQMMRLAYQKSKALQVADGIPILNGADGDEHARLVQAALARYDAVPSEVLADYPNLLSAECDSPVSPIRLTYGDNGRQMFFEGERFMVLNPYQNHAEKLYASGWVWFQRNARGDWRYWPDPDRGEYSQVGAFSLQEALAYAERVLNLRFELVGAPEDLPDSYPLPPQWEGDPAPGQKLVPDFADPPESRPVFTKQVTGAAAAKLLAEAATLVPEMCGVGDKERLDSPEEPTEFERWELALLTGMLNKRDSAFHRSLKAITQPETLQLALDRIPKTDAHRRTLVEQRLEILSE